MQCPKPSLIPRTHRGHSKSTKNYLLLAQDREMQYNFKWVGISGDDYEFGDTTIKSFGGLISSFFYLFE